MMNINSAKTGTRACKPSAVVSTDSPRAVKRDFCRTLLMTAGFIQPLLCSLPNDQTKPIWKEQNESSARYSNTEFCDSGQCMLKLFSVRSSLVLSEQRIPNPPQSSPNRVPVWFPPATSQLFLPLLKIFSADMVAKEHWVMVTVSCHQFCQFCAEIQWKKLKQSLWYSVEPDERDWYSCRHNVYKIRDLKAGALYFFLDAVYRVKKRTEWEGWKETVLALVNKTASFHSFSSLTINWTKINKINQQSIFGSFAH